jgi:nucleotide-binding universal stress UspA family protein
MADCTHFEHDPEKWGTGFRKRSCGNKGIVRDDDPRKCHRGLDGAGGAGEQMVSKRLSREAGHRRKFLTIVDETPECERAIAYAARRAQSTNGMLVLLYVVEPGDFQHWLGVEQIMREEASAAARSALDAHAVQIRERIGLEPELVVREGTPTEEIHKLIEEDQDIAILVLAAGNAKEGPGPLVSSVAGKGAAFPIPVTVVPLSLTDEEIESLA